MKNSMILFLSFPVVIVLCILFLSFVVSAESSEALNSLELRDVSDESKESIIEDLELKEVDFKGIEDFQNNTIITFDVSSNEKIAVGLNNYTILICDSNMNVETALCFNKNVTSECYYLGWNGDTLCLLMNRSSLIYYVTADGEIIDIKQYDVWNSDNTERLREITDREITVVNGTEYGIEKTTWTMKYLGGDKYDLLYRDTGDGDKEILFNSQMKTPTGNIAIVSVFIVGLATFAITILVVSLIIYRKVNRR